MKYDAFDGGRVSRLRRVVVAVVPVLLAIAGFLMRSIKCR